MNVPRRFLAFLLMGCYAAFARVVACFFFCRPARIKASRRFYRMMFRQRGSLYHLWCVFKQFQNFTTIHADRFRVGLGAEPVFLSDGLERLAQAVENGDGAILLMSHLGNWEMAAWLLTRRLPAARLLLYMGEKEKEGIEKSQKDGLRRAGVSIAALGHEENDPFRAVAGLRFLQDGGIVSLAGDTVWQKNQRFLEVDFFAGQARLPAAPFALALASGAPIFVFFAFRIGQNSYHFRLSDSIVVRAENRAERGRAMQKAAQRYAELLEQAVSEHPFQWYHFDDFLKI